MTISLDKRAEKVGIILAKRGVTKIPTVRVGAVMDVSGSAQGFYTSGIMQETLDRLMGVALKFDDNGELDVWAFSNSFKRCSTASAADAGSFINNKFLKEARSCLWNGTSYAPVLKDAVDYYFKPVSGGLFGFGGKKSYTNDPPAMVLFITDGSNDDRAAAAKVLKEAEGKPVYFMMVGIGPEHYFGFIKEQADLLPNVGFVNLNDLSITDDDLYEQLVSGEFATWVKQFVK